MGPGGMNIVFFGSGSFGLPVLESLEQVTLVVSQPDRPAGRRRRATPTPIAAHAEASGLPLLRVKDVNDPAAMETIRSAQADAWVVIAFGQKLSPALLADRFAINLHGSLLPRWRGAAPIHHAVMAGDTQTGVSVITLADRMDAGDVLAAATIDIALCDTTGDLHDSLSQLGPDCVHHVLQDFATGVVHAQPQIESAATAAPKLSRQSAAISPDMSAIDLRCRINGCAPWPGCDGLIDGQPLRFARATSSETPAQAGTLSSEGVLGCTGGAVRLLEVQPRGGRVMPFADWANGCQHSWPVSFEAARP